MILRKVLLTLPILSSLIFTLIVLVNPVFANQFFNLPESIFVLFILANLAVMIHIVNRIMKSDMNESEKIKKVILIIFFSPYIILYLWDHY
jgi:hypothetical protein